jgi:hypothetical protein
MYTTTGDNRGSRRVQCVWNLRYNGPKRWSGVVWALSKVFLFLITLLTILLLGYVYDNG